ncbi:MAG: DUF975 family protein [Lachnospiraceae bacterium]|nr:DUF975 family protein [Lachnospiraceae bacterium]
MWRRKDIKGQGKAALKRSYWKSVLVSLLLSLVLGSSVGASFGNGFTDGISGGQEASGAVQDEKDSYGEDADYESAAESEVREAGVVASTIVFVSAFFLVLFLIAGISVIIDVFILNPLQVGGARFFIRNQTHDAQVKNLMHGFDHGWKNITKTMFFYDMYRFLWLLLLIVPGIVKSYEYRMVPYLLAEDPDMEMEQVFATSKRMMSGNKWAAFKLDLSFLGWYILSCATFGILEIFYVTPYRNNVDAVLYLTLREK